MPKARLEVTPPTNRTVPEEVNVEIEAKKVIGEMARRNFIPAIGLTTAKCRDPSSGASGRLKSILPWKITRPVLHHHSIDLHPVNGPGGGATVTMVEPGQSKTFSFTALNRPLCLPLRLPNVATHMAHGIYGLILIEPEEGLPEADKEFYVMQGEFYSAGNLGKKGLQVLTPRKWLTAIRNI